MQSNNAKCIQRANHLQKWLSECWGWTRAIKRKSWKIGMQKPIKSLNPSSLKCKAFSWREGCIKVRIVTAMGIFWCSLCCSDALAILGECKGRAFVQPGLWNPGNQGSASVVSLFWVGSVRLCGGKMSHGMSGGCQSPAVPTAGGCGDTSRMHWKCWREA